MKKLEDQMELAKELIAKREEIDDQLAALFSGVATPRRKTQKCSKCNEEGHTARTCPNEQKPSNGFDPNMRKEPTFDA